MSSSRVPNRRECNRRAALMRRAGAAAVLGTVGLVTQYLGSVALVVRDYDEAIAYYRGVLGFELREDTDLGGGKRWVVVAPVGSTETSVLLARAVTTHQESRIGDQAGGRVFLLLRTDDFARDHADYVARGVRFVEEPRHEAYGSVAVTCRSMVARCTTSSSSRWSTCRARSRWGPSP